MTQTKPEPALQLNPEEAALLYRLALKEWPHVKALREGLTAAEGALREPNF